MLSSKKTKAQLTEDLAARDAQIADLNNQLTEMAFHAHEVEDDLKTRYEEDLVRAEELAAANDQRDELIETIEELEFLLDNAYEQQVDLADEMTVLCSMLAWVSGVVATAKAYRGEGDFVQHQLDAIVIETGPLTLDFLEVGETNFAQAVVDTLSSESEEALEQYHALYDIPDLGLSEDIFSEGGLTDTVAVDLPDVEVEDDLSQVALNALAFLYRDPDCECATPPADNEAVMNAVRNFVPEPCDDPACGCHAEAAAAE
jgi:hypothetical protein